MYRWLSLLLCCGVWACQNQPKTPEPNKLPKSNVQATKPKPDTRLQVINASFLGGPTRDYYGEDAPDSLQVIWQLHLGKGKTQIKKDSVVTWVGAGWTGQPLMTLEEGKLYIYQGAYDHHLKKIDAETGKIVWQYNFGDVIKGSGSIWVPPNASNPLEEALLIQGSRQGHLYWKKEAYSVRAIRLFTGQEIWRFNVPRTKSYSRDCDASAMILDDYFYLATENALLYKFFPGTEHRILQDSFYIPKSTLLDILYERGDSKLHGGNMVTESSPLLLGDRFYISAGAGHVYGYDVHTGKRVWRFDIGSDLDGTIGASVDQQLFVPVEKQYIKGEGGLLKLNPEKEGKKAVSWYFTCDKKGFESWKGGVVGSATVNNNLLQHYDGQALVAFTSVDGHVYVLDQNELDGTSVLFDGKTKVSRPKQVFKYNIGPSICTPMFVDDKLLVSSYKGLYLFKWNQDAKSFDKQAYFKGRFEASPFVYGGRVYLAAKNGLLYCLGKK